MSQGSGALQVLLTSGRFRAAPAAVWERLLFFEQVPGPAPFLLSLLLPTPKKVEGRRSHIGDETLCVYAQGHLVKRITAAIPGRLLAFEVIEQKMAIGRGVLLEGGSYELSALPEGTRVVVETRYRAPGGWPFLWRPLEAAIGHAFHRHLLAALRHELKTAPLGRKSARSRPAAAAPATAINPSPAATHRP